MLVLSRRIGESIVIGDNVKVTVTKVSGNRITLAIDAPPAVQILRGELNRRPREVTVETNGWMDDESPLAHLPNQSATV